MNGRTCQLCGKPLSRIWAGSGGDFCSREHRNQHRLRCGMDTLIEANKHASLMRRRDHLRQFSTAQLQRESNITPRGFGDATAPVPRPLLRHVPIASALAAPRIAAGTGTFLDPSARGALGTKTYQARSAGKTAFTASAHPSVLPPRARSMQTALLAAAMVPIRMNPNLQPAGKRNFGALPRNIRRTLFAFRGVEPEPLGNISGKRTRKLPMHPKVGNAFRVSGSNGFRLPRLTVRDCPLEQAPARGMEWPESVTVSKTARHGRALEYSTAALGFRIPAPRVGSSPERANVAAMRGSGPVAARRQSPYELRLDARQSDWMFQPREGRQFLPTARIRGGAPQLGPGCIALKPVLSGAAASPRLEHAAFQPGEQVLITISYSWNASK
jgi:hypothetical protein